MRLRPLEAWSLLLAVLLGLGAGIGFFTFVYAHGAAYLTNDSGACANCHVMGEEYGAWMKGPHHAVAACNDCHTPHNLVAKVAIKARNGFWHSYYFTTGGFPEPIQASARSREIAEAACLYCHEPVVQAMGTPAHAGSREISCIRCHGSVGHLELSALNVGAR